MLKTLIGWADDGRLKTLISKLRKAERRRDDLRDKQSASVIDDDTDAILKIRAELLDVEATITELHGAIPVVENHIAAARQAEVDRKREKHAINAVRLGKEKRKAAANVDSALKALEGAVSEYRQVTLAEARELTAAGTGRGDFAPILRLNNRLRAALWRWCPTFCKEAAISRLTAARWQSLVDSHQNETADPDAAQMKRA